VNSTVFDQIVERSWLKRPSIEVAPDLIGCKLVRLLPSGQTIRGMIVETEAYALGDPAFHAYQQRTKRNSVVFGPAGRSYIYLIYGLYHCFNIVTDQEGIPSTVLIRALQIEAGETGMDRCFEACNRVAAGPGKLCRVMQIDRSLNACILQPGQPLWLEHRGSQFQQELERQAITFVQTTRIGLSQGTDLPWRWYVSNCPNVSRP